MHPFNFPRLDGILKGETEASYRLQSLSTDIRQAMLAILLTFIPMVYPIYNDYIFFGSGTIFFLFLAARLVLLAGSIALLFYIRRIADWRKFDIYLFAWSALMIAFVIVVNYSRLHYGYTAHIDVLIIMLIFIGIPYRLLFRVLLAALFTSACIILLIINWEHFPLPYGLSALLALLLANAGGLALSHLIYSFRRHQYLTAIIDQKGREELTRLASVDTLTGILNRRVFLELAEKELSRFQRYNGSFTILVMDIDDFKRVNDSYGHGVGDLVLQQITELINVKIRKSDIFGRLGGDEFSLLLIETPVQRAVEIAGRIKASCNQIKIPQAGLKISVSIGIAESTKTDDRIDQIIARADAAMYDSKENTRNRSKSI